VGLARGRALIPKNAFGTPPYFAEPIQ
jgi:hypothetical protein